VVAVAEVEMMIAGKMIVAAAEFAGATIEMTGTMIVEMIVAVIAVFAGATMMTGTTMIAGVAEMTEG